MTQRDRVSGLEKYVGEHFHYTRVPYLMIEDSSFTRCPFCGAAAGYRQSRGRKFPYRAECSDTSCGVATPEHYATMEEARDAWNRRVMPAP